MKHQTSVESIISQKISVVLASERVVHTGFTNEGTAQPKNVTTREKKQLLVVSSGKGLVYKVYYENSSEDLEEWTTFRSLPEAVKEYNAI